jgi:helicase
MEMRSPVELREGVLCDGEFEFREHNSGSTGVEAFQAVASRNHNQLVAAAAAELVGRGEQVLVLVPDAMAAAAVAFEVADQADNGGGCGELGDHEHTLMGKELARPLCRRVGFLHAGLSRGDRESLERGFVAGMIRALVVAPVLGVERRLRAANVVVDGRVWRPSTEGGPELVELTRSEYETIREHAADSTADCCRVILVTNCCSQAEEWMGRYTQGQPDESPHASPSISLEDRILDVVTVGLAKQRIDLPTALRKTFWGESHCYVGMAEKDFARAVRLALGACLRAQLIQQEPGGHLAVTELGKTASAQRMTVKTASLLSAWAGSVPKAAPGPLEIIGLLGQTFDATNVKVHLAEGEERSGDFRAKLLARIAQAGVSPCQLFNRLRHSRTPLSVEDAKRAKKLLVLQDWISEVPLQEIENRHGVWAGGIERIGETYGRLCQALARFCAAFGWDREWWGAIERLAERLAHGVQEDALPVARLRLPQAGRSKMRALREAGRLTPEAVCAAQSEADSQARDEAGARPSVAASGGRTSSAVRAPAPPEASATRARGSSIASMLARERGAGPPTSGKAMKAQPRPHHGADLVVDLALRKVVLWGVEFSLQPQLFDSLTALALRPGEVVSMAEIADQLQRLGGLERRPVAPEAPDLRYRLLRSMRAVLKKHRKPHGLGDLVQTVARSGLRLNCTAEVMRNRDELVD